MNRNKIEKNMPQDLSQSKRKLINFKNHKFQQMNSPFRFYRKSDRFFQSLIESSTKPPPNPFSPRITASKLHPCSGAPLTMSRIQFLVSLPPTLTLFSSTSTTTIRGLKRRYLQGRSQSMPWKISEFVNVIFSSLPMKISLGFVETKPFTGTN
jgi:hypothetical protein